MLHLPHPHALLLASCLVASAAAAPAAAQNLIANSGLDVDVAGWGPFVGIGTAMWSSLDVAARPGSGSLRLENLHPAGDTGLSVGQCLPITGGEEYLLVGDLLLPSGQASSGVALLAAAWTDGVGCTGSSAASISEVSVRGSWRHVATRMVAPDWARSAQVGAQVLKHDAGGSLVGHVDNLVFGPVGTVPNCFPDESALCLQGGRFQVTASWKTPDGTTGPGKPVPLTADTGYFWFFSSANVEMVVKVLDACAPPFERFWVFASGLTNVFVRLEVTDTVTLERRVYENPQGRAFMPVLDTGAFATCP